MGWHQKVTTDGSHKWILSEIREDKIMEYGPEQTLDNTFNVQKILEVLNW